MGSDREYGKLYPLARALLRPGMHALYRMHITGLHHVPESGPAILCPNHLSFIDSVVLPAVLPRRISFVGKAEYMDSWKTRYLFPAVGMIPIDRGGGNASQRALDTAARVLERGELFGIYPEGTRSRSGMLHRGHTGPARLAVRTGAPIIPVGLRGTDKLQEAGKPFPNPFLSCEVHFGAPIHPERYAQESNRLAYRQMIDEVMFEIRRLSGQEYVDEYAGSKKREKTEPTAESGPEERPAVEPAPVEPPAGGEPVPVAVGAAEEDGDYVDLRPSSADVLAKWWS